MKKLNIITLALCALAGMSLNAHAQLFSLYRSKLDFLNALNSTNYWNQTFSNLTPGNSTFSPLNYTNAPYGFQVSNPGDTEVWIDSYGGKIGITTFTTAQVISLNSLSPSTRAIGGYLYANDANVITNAPLTITVATSAGSTNISTNVGSTSIADYFFGFIANDPSTTFSSVTTDVSNDSAFPTLSEVTISTVPEPSTYALLGLAASGLAVYLIRRRKA